MNNPTAKTAIRKTILLLLLPSLAIFFLITASSCSHVKPYYRSHDLKPTNISIDESEIGYRVLLIGDAGEPQHSKPVLERLQQWAALAPDRTVIVFLGDNIYPSGMPVGNHPNRPDAERRIMAQIEAVRNSGARGVFIPGNHDWTRAGGTTGRAAIQRQADFVNAQLSSQSSFLPPNGCADPAVVDGAGVRLIILDTHIWYEDEPQEIFADCQYPTPEAVTDALTEIIDQTPLHLEVIVAGHHPLISYGPRGGHFFWKDHLFPLTGLSSWLWIPLPGIGSLYPLARSTLLKDRNDGGSVYHRKMTKQLTSAFAAKKPLIYASGHDHALQVLEGGNAAEYLVISGAGSQKKLYDVGHGDETLFAHSHAGFVAVDFLKDGRILLRVVETGQPEVVMELWLEPQNSL